MCLAVPGLVVEVHQTGATVDLSGNIVEVSLLLTPEARVGDYVLVHAGFAIQVMDVSAAREVLSIMEFVKHAK